MDGSGGLRGARPSQAMEAAEREGALSAIGRDLADLNAQLETSAMVLERTADRVFGAVPQPGDERAKVDAPPAAGQFGEILDALRALNRRARWIAHQAERLQGV